MAGGPEPILWSIFVIVLGAKLGGEVAERFRQPAVLGELLVGVALGAALLGGVIGMPDFQLDQERGALERVAHLDSATHEEELAYNAFLGKHAEDLGTLEVLGALASIGVILLLFEVGLESDVRELAKVGTSSLIVAVIGIVGSFGVGYFFSVILTGLWPLWQAAGEALPNNLLHIFVGATLTATSVGITARVLGDMGRLRSREARIILGAAVLDDIAGLIILAIVTALVDAAVAGESVNAFKMIKIAVVAVGFLVVALLVGLRTVPRMYDHLVKRFKVKGFPVALAIAFAVLMSYLAGLAGLADIVGAFAAGLLLAQTKHAHHIFEDLRPIAAIFVSFFFVTLGMQVDLRAMQAADGTSLVLPVLLIGIVLTVFAMLAKLACGWGLVRGTQASRWVVGVGMAPRGEVGLIFAGLGLASGLILNWQYTAIIIVVMLTTFITPIWLERLTGSFKGLEDSGDHGENMSQILEA